jgi:predicted nucleic acid-binding protein
MLFPSIYIDTNILLDIIDGRRDSSLNFIGLLDRKKKQCVTAHFSLLEILATKQEARHIRNKMKEKERLDDACKERHKRKLTIEELEDEYKIIYRLLEPYKNTIVFWYLTDNGWMRTIEIMQRVNISAPDAIHVATSEETSCIFFISNDSALRPQIDGVITRAYSPDEFMAQPVKKFD